MTWALRKGKLYLIGDPNFIIAVDHKPLPRALGDRNLTDIDNPRLFKLKERTLPYSFTMKHIPGAILLPIPSHDIQLINQMQTTSKTQKILRPMHHS